MVNSPTLSGELASAGNVVVNGEVKKKEELAPPGQIYPFSSRPWLAAFWQPRGAAKVAITPKPDPIRIATTAGEQCWIAIEDGEARVKWDDDNKTWRLFNPIDTAKVGHPVKFQNGLWQVHSEVGIIGGGGALRRLLGSPADPFDKEIPPEIYTNGLQQSLLVSQTYTVQDAAWALGQATDLSNRGNFDAVFDQYFQVHSNNLKFNLKGFFENLYLVSTTFRRFFNYAADYDFFRRFERAIQGTRGTLLKGMSVPDRRASEIWTIHLRKNGYSKIDVQSRTLNLCSKLPQGLPEFYIGSEGDLVRVTLQRKAIHEFLHILTGITVDELGFEGVDPELLGLGERGAIVYLENRIVIEANLNLPKRASYRIFGVRRVSANTERIKFEDINALIPPLKNISFEILADRAITLMNLQDAYLDHLFPLESTRQEEPIVVGPADFLETVTGLPRDHVM
jgi:hypothetical protein